MINSKKLKNCYINNLEILEIKSHNKEYMANNPNHMDNLQNIELSHDEAMVNGKKGGIAKGKADRLNIRLAKASTFIDKQNLRKDKRVFRLLWKKRNSGIIENTTKNELTQEELREELRERLKILIEKMRIIRYCGSDALTVLAIANNPLLALTKPDVVIKAQAEVWDRREGKATQNVVNSGSIETKTVYVEKKETEDYKKHINHTINGD